MPLTTSAKNVALDAVARATNPTLSITHVGLMTKGANKSVTGVASTDIFTSTSHGFAAGDLVVFSGLTGGTGIVAGYPYFVIAANLATNTFQVSEVPGGSSINFTADLSAGTVNKLTEMSGGSPAYARVAIAFAAASGGVSDDSTNGAVVNVPAGGVVDFVSYHSASASGTVMGISSVTQETFAGQGTYTVTDAKVDLNV